MLHHISRPARRVRALPPRARRGACSARGRGGAGAGRVGRLRCRGLERRGTQFTCFTGTKVQTLTPEELLEPLHSIVLSCDGQGGQPSWHVRTVSVRRHRSSSSPPHTYRFEWNDWVGAPQGAGTLFTFFTGTKVQILTQRALQRGFRAQQRRRSRFPSNFVPLI